MSSSNDLSEMDFDSLDVMVADFANNLHTSTPQSIQRSMPILSRLQGSCETTTEDSGIGSLPSTQERTDKKASWNSSNVSWLSDMEFRGQPLPRLRLDDEFELIESQDLFGVMTADNEPHVSQMKSLDNEETKSSTLNDVQCMGNVKTMQESALQPSLLPSSMVMPTNLLPVTTLVTRPNVHVPLRHFANSAVRPCKLDLIEDVRQTVSSMTAALLPTPPQRLIGISCGLDIVDILTELNAKNQYQPLKQILSYLGAIDLCSISTLCRSWRNIVSHDSASRERKLRFLSQHAPVQKENCVQVKKSNRNAIGSEPLSAIHNVIDAPKTDLFGSSNNTIFPFQITLAEHENWQRCPNCAHPSRVSGICSRGTCSSPLCGFDYCTNCHAPYDSAHNCERRVVGDAVALPRPPPSSSSNVGAKRSRNNLRRL